MTYPSMVQRCEGKEAEQKKIVNIKFLYFLGERVQFLFFILRYVFAL